jgi:hypothetical protein
VSVLTLTDAKRHLNLTTTVNDAELQPMIDSAEATIGALVGQLSVSSVTERYVSTGGAIRLRNPAVGDTITSAVHLWSGMTLAPTDVELVLGCLTRRYGVGMIAGPWDVTYQAGRSTVPADLLMAVKELVRHLWDTQRGPTRRPGSAPDGPAPGAAYLLPNRVQELIAPYLLGGFA